MPLFLPLPADLIRTLQGASAPRILAQTARRQGLRFLLTLVFLPYEALMALDAISTTLYRMFVSRRRMLQWTTAAHTARAVWRR